MIQPITYVGRFDKHQLTPLILMSEGQNKSSMKLNYLFILILIIIFVTAFLLPEIATSQPSFPDDPDQIPIDGGLTLLFAAGSGFAIKKYRQKRSLLED